MNVFQIRMAPLRERPEDILPLAETFLEELGPTLGRPAAGISRDARERLLSYSWPGNVRELRNAIERAIILCDGGLITSEHLPAPSALLDKHSEPLTPGSGQSLPGVERELVESALKKSGNNKARAARRLGITRSQLYSRIQKYGIQIGLRLRRRSTLCGGLLETGHGERDDERNQKPVACQSRFGL